METVVDKSTSSTTPTVLLSTTTLQPEVAQDMDSASVRNFENIRLLTNHVFNIPQFFQYKEYVKLYGESSSIIQNVLKNLNNIRHFNSVTKCRIGFDRVNDEYNITCD